VQKRDAEDDYDDGGGGGGGGRGGGGDDADMYKKEDDLTCLNASQVQTTAAVIHRHCMCRICHDAGTDERAREGKRGRTDRRTGRVRPPEKKGGKRNRERYLQTQI